MDKRLPLALFLSFLVLMLWTWLNPPRPKPAADGQDSVTEASQDGGSSPSISAPGAQAPEPEALPTVGELVQAESEETFELELGTYGDAGHFFARFTNRGAALKDLRLGGAFNAAGTTEEERTDPDNWVPVVESFTSGEEATRSMLLRADASAQELTRGRLEDALWQATLLGSEESPEGIEFTYAPGSGVTFVKRYRFAPGRHGFELELELRNTDFQLSGARSRQFILTPAAGMPANSGDSFWRGREPMAVAAGATGDDSPEVTAVRPSKKERTGPIKFPGELRFAGAENKYFALLVRDAGEGQKTLSGASYRQLYDDQLAIDQPKRKEQAYRPSPELTLSLGIPEAGRSLSYRYSVYAGPKDEPVMYAVDPEFVALLDEDLGFFSPISHVLLAVLRFLQSLVGNWGVAIILLTILVRATLFPLNRRSQTTMARYQAKMKRLQPKIDEIKERFKNDAQKQRQEQATLMQQEGLFPPLGGCLPMFLQLPVFFGLYRALGSAYELRQAPFFGWIQDLSLPDQLVRLDLNTHLPFIGTIEYLNILPPIMVVTWILQQRGMPTPADEQAARMQKMMMWMPVMMGFFLYNYASGLSLYMITQSSLGLFELKVIKKYWPVDDTEQPKKKKKSGFMARIIEQQQQQMKVLQERQRQQERRKRGGSGGGKGRPKKA